MTKQRRATMAANRITVSFDVSAGMARRMKRYENHLRQLRPNVRITRAGLVRALIERGLLAFELDEARKQQEAR